MLLRDAEQVGGGVVPEAGVLGDLGPRLEELLLLLARLLRAASAASETARAKRQSARASGKISFGSGSFSSSSHLPKRS